jgi:hypothetical protein
MIAVIRLGVMWYLFLHDVVKDVYTWVVVLDGLGYILDQGDIYVCSIHGYENEGV